MATSYRIAGRMSSEDLTRVDFDSHFARSIRWVIGHIRPGRVIETGTYHGTGTTAVIAASLRDAGLDDARFYSIEVNPRNVVRARENLARRGLAVEILNGLSVPRALLPTLEQIEQSLVKSVLADGLVVDHEETDRARMYFNETDFPELPDDLLGQVLREFDERPDLVLLDSGGHMGFIEFRYLIDSVRAPCVIALDDIGHVKHFRSYGTIQRDERFEVLSVSEEKFGFCIARFDPHRR
jgi:hypothetical protein